MLDIEEKNYEVRQTREPRPPSQRQTERPVQHRKAGHGLQLLGREIH